MLLTLAAMLAFWATAQDTSAIQPRPALDKPTAWTLQQCIDYAKQQNITIKKNRVNVRSAQLDLQDAKNARLPEVSFSTSQNLTNRPFQKNTSVVNGSQNQYCSSSRVTGVTRSIISPLSHASLTLSLSRCASSSDMLSWLYCVITHKSITDNLYTLSTTTLSKPKTSTALTHTARLSLCGTVRSAR